MFCDIRLCGQKTSQNVSWDGCRVAQMFPRTTLHTFVFIFQNTKRCSVSALETLDRGQILLIHKCLFQLLAFISLWRALTRSINGACLWIHGSVCHHWSRSRMPFTLMLIFMPSVHFLLNSYFCMFGLNMAWHNQWTHALSFFMRWVTFSFCCNVSKCLPKVNLL